MTKFFDQNPHPLIEDHYHIQMLFESQEKKAADRAFHKERIKEREDRDDLIKSAEGFVTTDFYCSECKLDFKSQAIKQIEEDWSANQRIAYYKTKCFKGHWCMRLITDKEKDGYYQKSRMIAKQRGMYHNDILQPFETNYNLVYGKK